MSTADDAGAEAWELLFELFRRHRAYMRELTARFGLPPMDLHAVRALEPDEPMAVGDLARRIYCDPPNIVKVVERLVSADIVERRRDPADARRRIVALTPRGVELHGQVTAAFAELPPAIAALSPDDRRHFRDLLQRMLA